ncbi:MAG: cupredoxin domain-containing protein [Candidatus Woesearchaeota archaeon]
MNLRNEMEKGKNKAEKNTLNTLIVFISLITFGLLINSCAKSPIKEDLEKNKILGHTVVIDKLPDEKKHTIVIQATEKGFDVDTINVKKDDYLRLIITNRVDPDITRFYVDGYNIEEFYTNTQTIEVAFVAYKKGVFEFWDDSPYKRRGTLVVE